MTLKIEVEVVKPLKTRLNDDFFLFAATEWHRLYAPYVPMASGSLTSNVDIDVGEITHKMIYSHYQYNGENFNFRRDMHPLASAHWDEAAKPSMLPVLVASLQAFIGSGRGFD